ncbi:MAG: hypothetical protein ACRC80_00595, partial [Waterburya sp.]
MTSKSKSRKAPPPIVFILLGLVIFGGTTWFKKNSQNNNKTPQSIIQSQPQPKRFSLGEHLLIKARATNEKQQGIKAFANQDYQKA